MAFTCLDVIVPRRNPSMFVMLLWVKGELGIAYHLDGKKGFKLFNTLGFIGQKQ